MNAFAGREIEEYADFESGSAEVVKVKTGADSGFKQVTAEFNSASSFGGIQAMTKRRYVAGNGTYICLHENTELSPQEVTGSTMESAAGETQCVRNRGPAWIGFAVLREFSLCAGKSERSSLKC
ncbi:hypothetical protein [Agrobacterium larrymoorei]|uniref:hypothetical protein n=1 Tax=Agrobacterium larrymoorei TaxID=160699 RepID=UPI001F17488C|nr:hypothetical protein [Agrobacterium larrymoorei]